MRLPRLLTAVLSSLIISACNFSPIKSSEPSVTPDTAQVEVVNRSIEENKPAQSSISLELQAEQQLSQQEQSVSSLPAEDLWIEIRNHLSLDRHLDNKKVQAKIAWFARNQDYLDRVTERATPYLYHVVTELKRHNMPLELALLPVIESAYQPFAYSPSRASGIWQFIPGTGKRFGLKQNWWYDGRRDIISATGAALKYLGNLNQRFNGDWELSLAAYNAGEFRIERAIKKNRKKNRDTRFWSLDLPRETDNYVPGLLAISEIVANPEKYNVRLKAIANQPYFSVVNIDGQIDLAKVSELSGLSMDDVYKLNPGFNRWATDPNGPHRLLLPVQVANQFEQGLAKIPAEERISWQRYTIRSGDTLGAIANRYKTSVVALKDTNQLRNSRIRAGKSLLIPVSSKPAKHYSLSQDSRRFKNLKSTGDGKKYLYTVKRGDTLWDIGRHYGFSVRELCKWNGIHKKTILRLGQKLAIYVQEEESEGKIIPAVAHSVDNNNGTIRYTVQEGDSLWLIARKFGVSVKELRKWNKLPVKRHLQPGQRIEILPTTGV